MTDIGPLKKLLEQKRQEIAQLDRRRETLVAQEEAFAQAVAAMTRLQATVMSAPAPQKPDVSEPPRDEPPKTKRSSRRGTEPGTNLSKRWREALWVLAGRHRNFTYKDISAVPGVAIKYAFARSTMLRLRKAGLVDTVSKGVFRLTPKAIALYGDPKRPPSQDSARKGRLDT